MPDDEGYLLPGELPLGAYAAGEMDLGEPLRRLAGFGRGLEPAVGPCEEFWDDETEDEGEHTFGWCWDGTGAYTGLDVPRYVSPDQLETWAAVRGWNTRGLSDT